MGGMYMVQHVYTTTTSASRSTLACPVTSRNDLRVLMQVQDSAACQRQSLTRRIFGTEFSFCVAAHAERKAMKAVNESSIGSSSNDKHHVHFSSSL